MANEIKVKFKGKKNSISNVLIEELPNIGDKLAFPGDPVATVIGKTFHYDNDAKVIEIEFELT
ncbi:hypothetical protein [Pseudomonas sp.]|jgi:hypothetical protein|uniref:hypothetical protein n=1 Tax=Pseudomonas sp. TaxID=306 RepID=UPI003D6E8677